MDLKDAAAKAAEAVARRGLRTRIDEIAEAAASASERLQVRERLASAGQYVVDAARNTAVATQDLKVGERAALLAQRMSSITDDAVKATEQLQVSKRAADAVEYTGKAAMRAADGVKHATGAIIQKGAEVVDIVQRHHEQIADHVDTVAKGSSRPLKNPLRASASAATI
ncbi:hypothetical protein [Xenophilus sp. Marseille-Q4582]|uniref:hypothetical protein n=1 Tax=Xenophilus sp. Marseille-Q4582 TaxID=2866600 RepID=UPI001CE46B2C|nr:hypothetical protein [Xenophilus sp. Marseille-Q4582]